MKGTDGSMPASTAAGSGRASWGDSQEMTLIGLGRIGSAFQRVLERAGVQLTTLRRGQEDRLERPLPPPLIVATRLNDLDALIPRMCPENRRRLVLVQNGFLPAVVSRFGIDPVTVGVLYLAATDRVSEPRPGLPSVFFGPDAAEVAGALDRGGIPSRVAADRQEMCAEEATKLLWLSIVAGLSCAHRAPVDVVVTEARARLEALVDELLPAATRLYGCSLDRGRVLETLIRYSLAIHGYRGGGTELDQRNLLLWRAGGDGPAHRALLEQLGVSSELLE